jgi:hypothetical protein
LWLGTIGSLTFLFTAGVAARRIGPDARDEVSRRGALELIWRFDGDRLGGFDYRALQQVDADGLKRLSTVVFRRLPDAAADPRYATEQFALPAGTYEARVWSAVPHGQGEVLVSAYDRLVFGRADGVLANPSVVRFELPCTGRLIVRAGTTNLPDRPSADAVEPPRARDTSAESGYQAIPPSRRRVALIAHFSKGGVLTRNGTRRAVVPRRRRMIRPAPAR